MLLPSFETKSIFQADDPIFRATMEACQARHGTKSHSTCCGPSGRCTPVVQATRMGPASR
ncbi:hypothetical protein IMZ48_07660 [Candidatus Bathyarchaeota archaeon]|nr:hypothetical protein [Candidatus Bathyarchaeota archaeon]